MVDESSQVAASCSVDDAIQIDPEQVRRSDADSFVLCLPQIGQHGPHDLADVLDDHLVGCDRLQREQTPVVDGGFAELELLLAELCSMVIQQYQLVNQRSGSDQDFPVDYLELVEFEQIRVIFQAERRE